MPNESSEDSASEGAPHDDQREEGLPETDLVGLEATLVDYLPVQEDNTCRAARLENDRRLFEVLRDDCFEGPRYQTAASRWMDYGWRAVMKWINSGEIFHQCSRAHRPISPNLITTTWTLDDRHGIATEAVINGHALFREYGLVQGRWSPDKGASLSTYFVGASIRAFRPVYLRWFGNQQTREAELGNHADHDMHSEMRRTVPAQRVADPYYAAATHDAIKRTLLYIPDPQVRAGFYWRALGYTQAEAAKQVGLTEKALERRISRTRARVRTILEPQLELWEEGAL